MNVVFCSDPLEPRRPDPVFSREVEAARALGMRVLAVDHDALERRREVKRLPDGLAGAAVYRGWMLRAGEYRLLHDALVAKGLAPINTPEQYAACHHAPQAYPHVERWTAKMSTLPADRMRDDAALGGALAAFGAAPVVLKDWVKSQAAGYWHEACFIPDARDLAQVRRVVDRFVELQGDSLVGGLVFRAYVPLARDAGEWRAFVLDGKALGCWRRAGEGGEGPPDDLLRDVARALPSRFATMDFAQREDGGWLLIETGDGQVSELPASADPGAILEAISFSSSPPPRAG